MFAAAFIGYLFPVDCTGNCATTGCTFSHHWCENWESRISNQWLEILSKRVFGRTLWSCSYPQLFEIILDLCCQLGCLQVQIGQFNVDVA